MMTKVGSTNIVNFMTRGAGVFKLRRGHVHATHNSEYVLSFYSYNIQLIAFVLGVYNAAFLCHC